MNLPHLALSLVLAIAPLVSTAWPPETGVASWYGHPYHGRRTADGEIYDMEQMTAAHRTLPFNTRVRVANPGNGKTVEVRINDRGPFVDGRIIDLSHAAARAIGLVEPGVTPVLLEILEEPADGAAASFGVQVGAFLDRANAERFVEAMRECYGAARLTVRDGEPVFWRVQVGAEATEQGARALAARLRRELGQGAAFVVRLDP